MFYLEIAWIACNLIDHPEALSQAHASGSDVVTHIQVGPDGHQDQTAKRDQRFLLGKINYPLPRADRE
jgi:hypothetical protein